MDPHPVPLDVDCKLQSAERQIQRCRETGNPQHLYYAQQSLIRAVEDLGPQWSPETDKDNG